MQSLGWSEFFSDHGLSFLPRGQKHWGRGRRMSIEVKQLQLQVKKASPLIFVLFSWETGLLPLLVLTRRGRSTGKNQYW